MKFKKIKLLTRPNMLVTHAMEHYTRLTTNRTYIYTYIHITRATYRQTATRIINLNMPSYI